MSETNEKILSEIIKMRKVSAWTSIMSIIILIVVVVYGYITLQKKRYSNTATPTWNAVEHAYDSAQYDKGFKLAKKLASKSPDYYLGYAWMGTFSLIRGDLETAEKSYQKAYDLMPTEKYKAKLQGVKNAIAKSKGQIKEIKGSVKRSAP